MKKIPAVTPAKTRTFDRKQDIIAASAHLGVSDYAVQQLTVMAAPLYEDVFANLLELLSQPDPHKDLVVMLLLKHRDKDIKLRQIADWIVNANACYHAVNTIIHEHNIESSDLTGQVVEGVHHYRGTGIKYSAENIMDFARITAAAFSVLADPDRTPEQVPGSSDIFNFSCIAPRHCAHLNQNLMQLAAASHETAERMVGIILDNGIVKEAQLLHLLNNAPRALVDGAL
jgi:hypothetical protein